MQFDSQNGRACAESSCLWVQSKGSIVQARQRPLSAHLFLCLPLSYACHSPMPAILCFDIDAICMILSVYNFIHRVFVWMCLFVCLCVRRAVCLPLCLSILRVPLVNLNYCNHPIIINLYISWWPLTQISVYPSITCTAFEILETFLNQVLICLGFIFFSN